MDPRNKINEAYLPDKNSRGEVVVIGLSGGINSLVAASLLKIQKFDLIAVTVLNSWKNFTGEQDQVLNCYLNEAKKEAIKAFCHQLNIPHYFVNSDGLFTEEVVERWASAKIIGKLPVQCWSCHELRMRVLYQKMQEMGAHKLATGHLAKIYHNEASGTAFIHSSNDEENDQSAVLARVPKEILASLILPLSDLQKKEVVKLGENFGLQGNKSEVKFQKCFPSTDQVINELNAKIPESFIKPGEILSLEEDKHLGEHEGVTHFQFGEPIKAAEARSKLYFAKFDFGEDLILAAPEEYFQQDKFVLWHCHISEQVSWKGPFEGVIHSGKDFIDCWVSPKALNTAYVETSIPFRLLDGQIITIFKKKGKNSKILLSGQLRYLPHKTDEEEGEGEVRIKVGYEL